MTEQQAKTIASARMLALRDWRESGLNAFEYADAVKKGERKHPALSVLHKISGPTLHRWEALYNRENSLDDLAPKVTVKRGAGSRKLGELEKNLIQTYYLRQTRPQLTKSLAEILEKENIDIPYGVALRYIRELPPSLIAKTRHGAKKVNDAVMPYVHMDYSSLESMEMVTSDHHHLDMYVIERLDGNMSDVFRPWITAFQDLRSRKIIGWVLCRNPNSNTILSALKKVIDLYGVPQKLLIDNGKDYKSKALNGSTQKVKDFDIDGLPEERCIEIGGIFHDIGCEVSFAEPYHGQSKPIERWFRELAEGFCKRYETYCGSNTVEKPEDAKLYFAKINKMEKRKVEVTFKDVARQIDSFINNWNATHKHSGDGMEGKEPDTVFKENWHVKRFLPEDKYDIVFSETAVKTVSRCCVQWDATYASEELHAFLGQKVLVRRPLEDISRVYITTLEGAFICRAEADRLRGTRSSVESLREVKRLKRNINKKIAASDRVKESNLSYKTAIDALLNREVLAQAMKEPEKKEEMGIAIPTLPQKTHKPVTVKDLDCHKTDRKKTGTIIGLLD